jgi:hypothetical protein
MMATNDDLSETDETEMWTKKEKDLWKDVLYEMLEEWPTSLDCDMDFETPNPTRDFFLQFTTLYWDACSLKCSLRCLLLIPGIELIYDPDVEYSDKWDLVLQSWKNNWDDCCYCGKAVETDDDIPLYTLFSDFKPRCYKGNVWMR